MLSLIVIVKAANFMVIEVRGSLLTIQVTLLSRTIPMQMLITIVLNDVLFVCLVLAF